jgi:DNA-binding PadR family transcriptional regulator
VYRLTGRGREALAGRRRAWEQFAGGVTRTLEALG